MALEKRGGAESGKTIDNAAFKQELLALRPQLYGFALSLTKNPTNAEDLVQDTFVKALDNWRSFKRGSNLGSWVYTILRNTFLDQVRKDQKSPEKSGSTAEVALAHASHAGNQEAALELKDTFAFLDQLPPKEREAIELAALRGFSYEEIAEHTNTPLNTVRTHIRRGRQALHKLANRGQGES